MLIFQETGLARWKGLSATEKEEYIMYATFIPCGSIAVRNGKRGSVFFQIITSPRNNEATLHASIDQLIGTKTALPYVKALYYVLRVSDLNTVIHKSPTPN